jgi:hypothetical protein
MKYSVAKQRIHTLQLRLNLMFESTQKRDAALCSHIEQLERDKKLLEAKVRNLNDLLAECRCLQPDHAGNQKQRFC